MSLANKLEQNGVETFPTIPKAKEEEAIIKGWFTAYSSRGLQDNSSFVCLVFFVTRGTPLFCNDRFIHSFSTYVYKVALCSFYLLL